MTINTPSMLCVEDYLDALAWAESVGGLAGLRARADANAKVLFDWIERTPWVANLAADPATRSNTSVCLRFADPDAASRRGRAGGLRRGAHRRRCSTPRAWPRTSRAYRTAPPGLRVWCGADGRAPRLELLTPWLDWAYAQRGQLT